MFIANFFFRSDTLTSANGGEVRIDALGQVTQTPMGNDGVRFEASDGVLAADQTWTLTGGAAGSGDSTIDAAITLTNVSSAPVSLELFYAADLDIAFDQANPNDETTVLSGSSNLMRDPVTLAQIGSDVGPSADAYQVYQGQFEVVNNFNSDLDGATTLDNTPSIGSTVIDVPGVTDAGFAYSWSIELAPGENITANASHVHSVVPEPTAIALLAVALGMWAVRRR
ncbi:MAG: PEP-CTERM sorting domain-containing protein [Planctomycetota bacterium]